MNTNPKSISTLSVSDIPQEYARKVSPAGPNHHSAVKQLETKLDSLLPIEQHLKEAIHQEIARLRLDLDSVKADSLYPRLDIGFMGLTKMVKTQRGIFALPRFAIYNVFGNHRTQCQVSASARWYGGKNLSISLLMHFEVESYELQQLFSHFLEPFGQLATKLAGTWWWFGKDVDVNFTANFTGAIPDQTRTKILEAHKLNAFDHIYIIAEAPAWQIDVAVPTPPGDPLVVGRKGSRFWLIDVFDITSIESYVATEFSSDINR